MSLGFFDLEGLPIEGTVLEQLVQSAAVWDDARRRIGLDVVTVNGEPVEVSTVFLPLDQNQCDDEHVPVLYETLISHGDTARAVRYTTRQDAQDGHSKIVAGLRGQSPEPS